MATPSAQTSAARKAAPAQQAALAELVDIARSHAESGLVDMVRRMVSALLDLTAAGLDPATVMRRVKSGNLLKDNGYAFTHLATGEIEAALRREVARLLPRDAAPAAAPATAVELSLVPLEQIDQQMALGAVSRPFDLQHSEGLATLGVRLGLLLGRDLVRAAHNPFRPDVFLAAVDAAWRQFEPDPEAHGLVAPLLRPGLMFDLGPLYEALVAKLKARKGGNADTRFSKTDDRASRQAERARRDAALAQQLRQLFDPAVPEIPNLPQGSGGWRPSAASGFVVAPPQPAVGAVPSGAAATAAAHPGPVYASGGAGSAASPAPSAPPVTQSLSDLLARAGAAAQDAAPGVLVLPGLRASLPQGALSRGDETTLDLLSRVFGSVLQDDGVAPETRELIGHLQLPVLRTALRDRSFFFQEAHPARRLLDLLSQAGWERPLDADDPVYRAMRRSVERVRGQVDPEFDVAVADLEAGLAARDHIEEAAMAAPIAQAMRSEKRAAAERSARRAVALRMAGEQLIPAVSGFLEGRWSAALALAYTIEDSRPGAVDNATRTMEDLIWSVKPKATQEQRKALIARLPALLASLNNWLDATRWQDAERLQFFAALAECHASIVRAPIELLPERQLELALEAAQQDALRRVAQEQEEEREQARLQAEEAQVAASDPAAAALAGLERGMRLELNEAHIVRRVRLAWVSPLRTLYIFSGAGRQEAFSLPAARLGELLREGAMRVVAAEGVVGRILGAAVEPMPAMV